LLKLLNKLKLRLLKEKRNSPLKQFKESKLYRKKLQC
jgi:hypothetical protein